MYVMASIGNIVICLSILLNILGYSRTEVIVSRTSFVIAFVRSSVH
jgi:hypothetical protein